MTPDHPLDFYTRTVRFVRRMTEVRPEAPKMYLRAEYPISGPRTKKCVLSAMSVLSQPPSDVVPVVADATVLSTEVRMGLARCM